MAETTATDTAPRALEAISRRRRLVFIGLVLLTAAAGTAAFLNIMAEDGLRATEIVGCLLFAFLSAWIAIGFWTALLGFFVLVFERDRYALDIETPYEAPPADSPPRRRTALVMPVYNEDPTRCYAALRAAFDELHALGADGDFDFFILSDSRSAEARLDETVLWAELAATAPPGFRLFYRWREKNTGRKSGNIEEFCQRWGSRYDYMIVYDADSVVGGATLRTLVAMMDRYPQVGIIQTPPLAVNRRTLFARLHQFAASVYGPIFNAGQAWWALGDSNYIGHNAIIRVAPFMQFCGLAPLPGKPPLGGEILSHDFVEAGLMRRGGYQVWMAYGLGESYEEPPPTLIDYAKRDRRWAQGNMQHLRLLGLSGLQPITRLHFLFGGLSYMAGGIWMMFLAAMLLNSAVALPEGWIVSENGVLMPNWPLDRSADLILLFVVTTGMLMLPKFLAVGTVLTDPAKRASHGGGVMPLLSALLETAISILTTPILLAFHIRFLTEILLGRSVGWLPQQRGEGGMDFGLILRAHLGHTIAGIVLAIFTSLVTPELFWWFSPVFIGLMLSIPVSALSGSASLGTAAYRAHLLVNPTEGRRFRPRILRRFDALSHRLEEQAPIERLKAAFTDPARLRLCAQALPPASADEESTVRAKLGDRGIEVLTGLSPDERLVALSSPAIRSMLHRGAWLPATADKVA